MISQTLMNNKTLKSKIATFGETMLRLSTIDNNRISQSKLLEISFAGSEANVAVDLAIWGKDTVFISAIPTNDIGEAVIYDLNRYKINTDFVIRVPNGRLGIFFVESGVNQLESKVTYDREFSAFINHYFSEDYFALAFENCAWLHWSGISPGLGFNGIENVRKAIGVAVQKKMVISCDLNYRSKLWGFGKMPQEVMPELLQNANIILGNEEDAQTMLSLDKLHNINVHNGNISHEHYKYVCQLIFEKFPKCNIIAFTVRESQSANHNNWSAILATRTKFYSSTKYEIKNIVDRVGAGDSFSAGIIYGLNSFGNDYQKVLNFATAASCLKHSIKGDYCLCKIEIINQLLQGNKAGRINR